MAKRRKNRTVAELEEKVAALEARRRKKDRTAELEEKIQHIEQYAKKSESEIWPCMYWAIEMLAPIAERNELAQAAYEAECEQRRPVREVIEMRLRQFSKERADYKRAHPFLAFWKYDRTEEERETARIKGDQYYLPPPPTLVTFAAVSCPVEMQLTWDHVLASCNSKFGWVKRDYSSYPKEVRKKLLSTGIRMKHVKELEEEYRFLKEDIRNKLDEEVPRLRKRLEGVKNAQGSRARVRAAAAAHFDKTRELAVTVKRQLRDQIATLPVCPYCGGPMGDAPEADHIHPVCLGGFSTPDNMVYVCAKCNGSKHDKTLREFIRSGGRDREEIEERLTKLGKRF